MLRCLLEGVSRVKFLVTFAVVALTLVMLVSGARAQLSTASITGIVSDPSGAAVPHAAMVLRNVDTSVELHTATNGSGNYVFTNVPPGHYTLSAGKAGFTTKEVSEFTLAVNQTATFNLILSVGEVTQTVRVQAVGTHVESSTSELGTVVGTQEVLNLPLNGRNFTELLLLTPGADPVDVSQNGGGGLQNPLGENVVPSINGQLNRSNLYVVDGITDLETEFDTYSVAPILDTIQEFKIDSHNDQARFGGVLGGVINIVTKSGTNQFHGDGWEFLRNNAFDARNPFLPDVTPFKQNQFGFTLGGPVVLPHYNGRDKTFFYVGYEGYRNHTANELLFRTATPADLSGDLSDLGVPIYNPYSTVPDPNEPGEFIRSVFPNNQIPSNMINPGMLAYAKATFPQPVNTGIPGINAINTEPVTVREDDVDFRVDERLGQKDMGFFRWDQRWQPTFSPQQLVNLQSTNDTKGLNWVASETHTFSPSAILQMEFGHTRLNAVPVTLFSPAPANLDQESGFNSEFTPSVPSVVSRPLIPSVSIAGFLSGGETGGQTEYTDVYEGRSDLTIVRGRHTLAVGADIAYNGYYNGGGGSTVSFAATQTNNPESPAGTGSAMASFLLGVPNSGSFSNFFYRKHGQWEQGYYVQDQWKATNNLTVNMGLRYDLTLQPYPGEYSDGSIYDGDLDLANGTYILAALAPSCSVTKAPPCIPGSGLPAHVVVSPTAPRIQKNTYDNINPRLGLAYRLGARTALRAGFGLFTDNWTGINQNAGNYFGDWPSLTNLAPSTNLNVPIPGSVTPTVPAQNPLGFGTGAEFLPPPTPFTQQEWYTDPNLKNPYSLEWNFGVEHQFGPSMILSANYVGSSTSRLSIAPYANTAVTPGPGNPTLRQPYPYIEPTYYSQSIGRSNYNAFQFQLNKHFGRGLMYVVSYTYSKAEDLGCSGLYGVEGCAMQNPYDLNADKSVSAFDLTHDLTASWVYQLPFGSGHKLQSGKRGLDYAIGGWQVNGIMTLTSGIPYNVMISSDIANTGNSDYERLNLIGNWHVPNITPAEGFNTSAFEVPPLYTYGNVGRNSLRTGGYSNFDLSLFRDFPITESKQLQFRFEAFNAFNDPTWGTPVTDFNDTNFGRIFSTRSTSRQLQLALKFIF